MRALTEDQTDSVAGGLAFSGIVASNGPDAFFNEYLRGMGNGSSFTTNGGNSGPYGSNLVDPVACKADVERAMAIGGLIGAVAGGALGGRGGGTPGAVGGAILGGAAGAALGGLAGLQTSPNCKPK